MQTPAAPADHEAAVANVAADPALEREIAALLVLSLNLDIAADAIDPRAPLVGDGLGLDSIDILELALVVSKKYGFPLQSDDPNNRLIFRSLRDLAQHIGAQRLPPGASTRPGPDR